MTWHDYSEQVLGFKNGIYKKYNSYEQAVIDFNASVGALTAPPKLCQSKTCATMAPVDGKAIFWKNVTIVTLLVLVFGLVFKLSLCSHCK